VHQPPRIAAEMPKVFYIMFDDLPQLFDTHGVLKSCYNGFDVAIFLQRKVTKQALT
jgi:hypothetical protein